MNSIPFKRYPKQQESERTMTMTLRSEEITARMRPMPKVPIVECKTGTPVIRFQRLHQEAILPNRNHSTDVGLDLSAFDGDWIAPGVVRPILTRIACEIPDGYWASIVPRSGLARKGVFVITGTVDPGYRGELVIHLFNSSKVDYVVSRGDRIAQLVLHPLVIATPVWAEELSIGERGQLGFGSSGK